MNNIINLPIFRTLRGVFAVAFDQKRIYGLDILRCIAILSVVLGHYRHIIANHVNLKVYKFFIFDGVTIFFVLSGFLIGGILIKIIDKKKFEFSDLFDFFRRRWFRTLPIYYLVLIILIILHLVVNGNLPLNWNYYVFFTQNIYFVVGSDFFPEAWSLSVEEWYYLLISTSLFLSLKIFKSKKGVLKFWIFSILILVFFYRSYQAYVYDCDDIMCWVINVRQLVITRLDSMMFGFLAAYLNFYKTDAFFINKNYKMYLGVLLILTPKIYELFYDDMFFNNYFTLPFVSLGTMLTLPYLSKVKNGHGYLHRFVTKISLISYSMYLLHYSIVYIYVFMALEKISPYFFTDSLVTAYLRYFVAIFLTISMSTISYKYFEIPMMKLRDRYGR